MPAVATVVSIQGEAFARNTATGQMKRLSKGDEIQQGEVVITSAGAQVQLRTPEGQMISMGAQESMGFGPESSRASAPSPEEAALMAGAPAPTVAQTGDIDVEQLLEQDAAAAGLGGGGENGGSNFVRLTRVAEGTTPLEYQFPVGPEGEILPFDGPAGEVEETTPAVPEIPILVTLTGVQPIPLYTTHNA